MALFKPLRGAEENLDTQPLHDGYAYFTSDTHNFYIDHLDKFNNTTRSLCGAGKNTPNQGVIFNSDSNEANSHSIAVGSGTKANGTSAFA